MVFSEEGKKVLEIFVTDANAPLKNLLNLQTEEIGLHQ